MLDTTVLFTSPDKDNLYVKKHIETDWKKKEHMVLLSVYTELTPKNKDIDYTANKARDILLCNTETSSKLPQMTVKVMNY